MELNNDIQQSIEKSVLCWLATCSTDLVPNVSPKEIFDAYGDHHIIIANIASPQTVRNIRANPKVCLSFIDILVQKGYQLKGKAEIVDASHADFADMEAVFLRMTHGKYPFETITKIAVESVKPIIAPRYILFPETTEAQQIESARKAYQL